ncbi:MAG: hypothetical protein AAB514_02805 [Patescibacteria group bacterium]
MVTITIPKNLIKDEGGVVILPLKEYQKLCEMAAPTYYLKGKAAKDLDKLVEGGLKEYHEGKCKTLRSLADLD